MWKRRKNHHIKTPKNELTNKWAGTEKCYGTNRKEKTVKAWTHFRNGEIPGRMMEGRILGKREIKNDIKQACRDIQMQIYLELKIEAEDRYK